MLVYQEAIEQERSHFSYYGWGKCGYGVSKWLILITYVSRPATKNSLLQLKLNIRGKSISELSGGKNPTQNLPSFTTIDPDVFATEAVVKIKKPIIKISCLKSKVTSIFNKKEAK